MGVRGEGSDCLAMTDECAAKSPTGVPHFDWGRQNEFSKFQNWRKCQELTWIKNSVLATKWTVIDMADRAMKLAKKIYDYYAEFFYRFKIYVAVCFSLAPSVSAERRRVRGLKKRREERGQ